MKNCEGACESHVGEAVTVHVEDIDGHDWGEWNYCEAAIAEDVRRGLIVTPRSLNSNWDRTLREIKDVTT